MGGVYGHPFGLHLCAPVEDLYLTGTTSGTTGTPTFSYTFTEKDINFVGRHLGHRLSLAGIGKGDRVVFFFALGIYATTMTLWGLRWLGALPIDIDARAGTDTAKPLYKAWSADWRSGVQVLADRWIVEVAIPWQAVGGRPRPGERRRANIGRTRTPGKRETSSWSPMWDTYAEMQFAGTFVFKPAPGVLPRNGDVP